ncbi:MAG: hypothetical protein KF819_34735 [Labilithrix sp.]|nr:hypothetical protein [Labilithrix sp.]
MKLLKLLLASLAVSSFAIAGCSADVDPAAEGDDDVEDIGVSQDELGARARQFVGKFNWEGASSGAFVDFEQLSLDASGGYTAKVDAGLVNPAVRCIRFPCTLPESGAWSVFTSGGKTKIRVNPAGRKPSRSYWATIANGTLSLTRFGQTTKLFKQSTITCANVRCAAGTHCEMRGINGGSIPVCIADAPPPPPPPATCAAVLCMVGTVCVEKPTGAECVPQPPCVKTGCSGHVCSDRSVITTCEFRPEYACYQQATCERQANGQCGFTQTPALQACLANP